MTTGPTHDEAYRGSGSPRRRPVRVREPGIGGPRPRPARLHVRSGQFLEAADAAEHRQAPLCRHADLRRRRPDRQRLPVPGGRDRVRLRLPRWEPRNFAEPELLQSGRRDKLHGSSDGHLHAADRLGVHPDADDADPADPADRAHRHGLRGGSPVPGRRAAGQRRREPAGRRAGPADGRGLPAGAPGLAANSGLRGRGMAHRDGQGDRQAGPARHVLHQGSGAARGRRRTADDQEDPPPGPGPAGHPDHLRGGHGP